MTEPALLSGWPSRRLGGRNIVLLVALVAGLVWTVLFHRYGVRLSGDSGLFLDVALGVHTDGVFTAPANRAPLYMVAIALMMVFDPFPAGAAALVTGLSLTGVLLMVGLLSLRLSRDPVISVLAVLVCAFWPAHIAIYDVAWTESLFTALVLGHAFFVVRHVDTGRDRDLGWAASLLAAAMLTRYAGLALWAVFVLLTAWIAWQRRGGGWRAAGRPLLVVALTPVPLVAWMLRNNALEGTYTGDRSAGVVSFFANLQLTADSFGEALQQVTGLGWLAIAALAVCIALWRRWNEPDGRGQGLVALYLVALPLAHQAIVIQVASTVRVDAINNRFVAPSLPFVLLLVAAAYGALQRTDVLGDLCGVPRARAASRLLVTGMLLAGIASVLGPLGAQADVAAGRQYTSAFHVVPGYNASPTARGVAALIAEELRRHKTLTLSVLSHPTTLLAAALPLRRGTLRAPGLELVGYRDHSDLSLVADVTIDGSPAEILFPPLSPVLDADRLRHRLFLALKASKTTEVIVLVDPKALKSVVGHANFPKALGAAWTVEEEDPIEPYSVFRVRSSGVSEPEGDDAGTEPSGDLAAAPSTDAAPEGDAANPFDEAGHFGAGRGWRPYLADPDDKRWSREKGTLRVSANAPGDRPMRLCGSRIAASGAVRVTGYGRSEGIEGESNRARVVIGAFDVDNQLIKYSGDGRPFITAAELRGTQDWVALDAEVALPAETETANVCVMMDGTAGTAWFRSIVLGAR